MKRILTVIVIGLVIIVMVVFGASCAGTSGTKTASSDSAAEAMGSDLAGKTIRILGTTEFWDMLIKAVIPDFEKETGMTVEFEQIGQSEQMQKARLELSKGSKQYDIVMISSYDNAIYYANGWCENIDALEKSTGVSFNRDTLIPNVLQSAPCQWEGVTYGLPTLVSTNGILLYRKDLIEKQEEKDAFKAKYGYDLVPPTTWDQYYDVAEFFTRKSGDKLAGTALTSDFYGNAMHLDAGGAVFDQWLSPYMSGDTESGADPDVAEYTLSKDYQPQFNSKAGVAAIDMIKKLYDNEYTYPGSLSMTWSMIVEPFRTNGAFMAYGWAEDAVAAMLPDNNQYASNLAWAPMPVGKYPRILQGGWVATINKNSLNKEAAYKFLAWLTSQETEAKQLKAGQGFKLPMRQKNFDDPSLMKGYEFFSVVADMMKTYTISGESSILPETDLVKQALNVELQRVVTGEKTSQKALDDAAAAIIKGLTEAGAYDRLK